MVSPRSSSLLTWLVHEGDPARQVHPLEPTVHGDEVHGGLGAGDDMGSSAGHIPLRLHGLVTGHWQHATFVLVPKVANTLVLPTMRTMHVNLACIFVLKP